MGVLLALAHEFDMPALTLRIKRMLMSPDGYIEDQARKNPPPDKCNDFMKVTADALTARCQRPDLRLRNCTYPIGSFQLAKLGAQTHGQGPLSLRQWYESSRDAAADSLSKQKIPPTQPAALIST